MARVPATNRTPLGVRCLHACQWTFVIVVPVVAGGLVGGSLGGIITAALLIPSFHHLLLRGDRDWAERKANEASALPRTRDRVQIQRVAPTFRSAPCDRQDSGV